MDGKYVFSFLILISIGPHLVYSDASASASQPKKVHAGRIPSKLKEYSGKKLSPGETVDNVIIPFENVPSELEDLKPEHKLLYLRARQNDYDYGKFGEACRTFSVDELDAFLQIFDATIEPSEAERDLRRRSNPQEKGERLEHLFNHSRTICDFRNLLTCHKNYRTCACAHPSMGLNAEGVCGVNIGHICEFSERTLLKHGIYLTPQTSPIKCLLENAECVMDSTNDILGGGISPIRKICKCRKGYWGATCRRRVEQEIGNYLENLPEQQVGPQNEKKVDFGPVTKEEGPERNEREFWIHQGSVSVFGGHSMHPEEVKEKLLELLNEQEMNLPEEREEKAKELVRRLEQDVDKEEMVINELHLRQLAHLKLGEACEPERQIVLDNPPVAKDGQRWVDPNPDDIKSWQLGLLQDKKPLCNVYKHFRCDATSRVCQCKKGLEPDKRSNKTRCLIPLGYNCGPDFDPILELDPVKDRKRFSEAMPPECVHRTECKDQPLFFEKKCWCKIGENCEGAFNADLFKSQVKALKSRFNLGLGDSCDPKVHRELLSYGMSDDPGFQKRVGLIQEILENPESRLCDIGYYLNCSETSRTCQCFQQLKPNRDEGENQCVATNMASCGRTFEYGKYMFTEGAQLWQVEKAFTSQFRPECISEAKCAGGDDLEWAGRCVCNDPNKSGEFCEDKKATLATAFKVRQIPNGDEEEVAMIRVFFDLNRQTNLLEGLMTLKRNQECDPDMGLKVDRVVKFWKEIGSSDDTTKERRTLRHFVALTKWTKYLVNTAQGSSAALCNVRVGLRCHRTTGSCGCSRGTVWVDDRCYLDVDEPCDPKPGAEWIPTCIYGTKCLSLRRNNNNYGSYQCTPCPKGRSTCEGNGEDERIYDTWDTDEGHIIQGRSFGSQGTEAEDGGEVKAALGMIVVDDDNRRYFDKQGNLKGLSEAGNNHDSKEKGETVKSSVLRGRSGSFLTPHQKETYLEEIERMLKDLLWNRTAPFGAHCNTIEEQRFRQVFPRLPVYDLNHLPTSIQMAYSVLSRLYWQGLSFCDRTRFLSCNIDGVCGCADAFGLVEEGGECRLRENKYCSISTEDSEDEGTRKLSYPSFRCRSGTKCTKVDYGLPVCVEEFEDEHDRRIMNLKRDLLLQGVDTVNQEHLEKSSSSTLSLSVTKLIIFATGCTIQLQYINL